MPDLVWNDDYTRIDRDVAEQNKGMFVVRVPLNRNYCPQGCRCRRVR